jgi:hypothetical protein
MKKLFLSVLVLFFVVSAFGQSGADNFNRSTITATGANTGTINQQSFGTLGYYSFSELTQAGSSNDLLLDQFGANDSFVNQSGAANAAVVFQQGGLNGGYQVSNITQSGENNYVDLDQVGDSNTSDINQSSPLLTISLDRNEAIVKQGLNSLSEGNASVVVQNNVKNLGEHTQDGFGNSASSTQESYGLASPFSGTGFLQGSVITQTGDRSMTAVTQTGDNNRAVVIQNADVGGSVIGFTNEATIMQTGEKNIMSLTQDDSVVGLDADNTLSLEQTNLVGGPGNSFTMSQVGASSWSSVQINN